MPNLGFSMTTWGSPASEKRALLLHGLMGTGQVFFKVAEGLVAAGRIRELIQAYQQREARLTVQRVDCPDLPGHGWAPHLRPYTIPGIAKFLNDNLKESYDLLGGVSFGATVAAALYTLLENKPRRVVLAEPVLDHPGIDTESVNKMLDTTKNIPSEESLLAANPKWIPEEASLRRLSLKQIDPEVIVQLCDELAKGHLDHSLLPSGSISRSSEIIILAGDPAMRSIYPAANAKLLEKGYPHVKFGVRLGATHDMHKDKPEVIVGVLLNGLSKAGDLGLEVLRS